ncbi:FUSC family protein, partial [Klebsiella pneumoniae]|nr:FUSC family protein [Klebsiella pneumoniae]
LLLAALQWGAELTVLMNYAFGLFFATPVALLVSAFNSSAPPAEISSDRLWATLLGAAVAVAVNWVSPPRAWVARVRTAMDRVHQLTATEPVPRAELRKALIELHEAYDVASGEVRSSKLPTEQLLEL